jgi:hypothetical protein
MLINKYNNNLINNKFNSIIIKTLILFKKNKNKNNPSLNKNKNLFLNNKKLIKLSLLNLCKINLTLIIHSIKIITQIIKSAIILIVNPKNLKSNPIPH